MNVVKTSTFLVCLLANSRRVWLLIKVRQRAVVRQMRAREPWATPALAIKLRAKEMPHLFCSCFPSRDVVKYWRNCFSTLLQNTKKFCCTINTTNPILLIPELLTMTLVLSHQNHVDLV